MSIEQIKKNSIYNSIKSYIQVVFPLITFPYISRVLQAENVGKINFIDSFMSYFVMISTLGINTYAIRECAKVKGDKIRLGKTASEIFTINLITTLLAYISLICTVVCVPKLCTYKSLIIIRSLTLIMSTLGMDWLNSAMEEFKYLTIRYIVFQVLSIILIFVFVHDPSDYLRYALISVLASSGANIANIWYRRRFCKIRLVFEKRIFRHMGPILTLFSMMFAQQILSSSDSVMLGFFCGDYAVGEYSVAVRISTMVNTVIASVTWVLMPQLSKAFFEKNYDAVKESLKYGIDFMATFGIPCAVGLFMMSSEIVEILAGPTYHRAGSVLGILAISLAVSYIGNVVFNMCLLADGKDNLCALNTIIVTMINIVLNYIFIPQYDIMAAAVTSLIAQVVSLFMAIPFVNRHVLDKDYLRVLYGPMCGGGIIIIWTYFIKQLNVTPQIHLLFAVCGSIILYFGIMILVKNIFAIQVLNSICKLRKRR